MSIEDVLYFRRQHHVEVCDVLDGLRMIPDNSVQCCVTSPPYYGLRDYGLEPSIWGGDAACGHQWGDEQPSHKPGQVPQTKWADVSAVADGQSATRGAFCRKCSAWRGCFGLEPTPRLYVEHAVLIFREVRRVLREDGTFWLNIGDSYCSTDKWGGGGPNTGKHLLDENGDVPSWAVRTRKPHMPGIKPKDLIGIPWMVAFALRQPFERAIIKSHVDRAWLAALIDGEGCITTVNATGSVKDGRAKNESYAIVVQVRMCDRQCLDKAAAITGMSHVQNETHAPSQIASGQRASSQWKISGENAATVLAEIYPYLLIKKKQAILAWNLQRLKDGIETKRGTPIPDDNMELRRELHRLIRAANQRQPSSIPGWCREPAITTEPGWYLRSEICWDKPNAMPDSCQDRPTKSHEQIFLFTKSATYFYDHVAIFEPFADERQGRDGSKKSSVRNVGGRIDGYTKPNGIDPSANGGKNKRSVWNIPVGGYRDAHFATFPIAIPETCLKAGTSSRGCCAKCGAPYERVTAREQLTRERPNKFTKRTGEEGTGNCCANDVAGVNVRTVGWKAGCECNANVAECLCLDPFNGAATTGLVAVKGLNLRYIGLEKNPAYAEMSERRIAAGFSEIVRQPAATAGQLALFGDD